MKGILWTIAIVILTLVFVVFLTQSIFGSIGEAVRTGTVLESEEITGIINIMQSSPYGTRQVFYLPRAECTLKLTTKNGISEIDFTVTKEKKITDIIRTEIQVEPLDEDGIQCDKTRIKKIQFLKCDTVKIVEGDAEALCPPRSVE